MTTERKDGCLIQDGHDILRLLRNLFKMNFFSWKLQSQLFLHMQLKNTSLSKGLPREKLEVNPFHVLETRNQL